MTATDLERELARLAATIDPPPVAVSTDVARGRRRLLRTRLTVAGAAVATAAVLGGGTLLGQGATQSTPAPVDRTPDAGRTGDTDPDPDTARDTPTPSRELPSADGRATYTPSLATWNDTLAEYLDPGREHLAPYRPGTGNQQTTSGGGEVTSLGSRFSWSNAGEEGLGTLEVSVSRRAGAASWPCRTGEGGVTCRDARGPDGEPARIGTSDSITTVQLEQADGDVVVLTLDLLFGNNSLVPISGTDVTPEMLLEAAADDRLSLPLPLPASTLDPQEFLRVGQEVLLEDGQELLGFPGAGAVATDGAVFEGRRQVALVTLDAYPTSAGYGLPEGCDAREFLGCERLDVDGQPVFVGELDEKFFPGYQVVLAGPENVVRVQWERSGEGGDEADLDALLAFVSDPRWQQ